MMTPFSSELEYAERNKDEGAMQANAHMYASACHHVKYVNAITNGHML